MASYNRVILMGNMTRDVELKYTPGGTAVTDIGLAVNDRRKNAQGEWVDETTFVDVTLWGRTAELASEYLSKGSPLFVEGRLKLDTWETDGQKRSKLRVVCDRMQFVGGREGGGSGGGSRSSNHGGSHSGGHDAGSRNDEYGAPPAARREAQPTGGGPGYDEEDIPF
ncbi:single-stranded DNA-binding protein [Candidatus Laterigemmans baculatus]|uniref:single-stranded DNA-binding protein n=1 Tax=Candidatus Laterigemmans baculatus TaxID=2770505 RepID=UPI0013D9FB6A|nr:single-stranded DNA-binding protein [Candidatus Laterigemmans baculatus]